VEKITVLIADGHPVCLQGLSWLLDQEADLDVVGRVSDGKEAIKTARESTPDVAIIDMAMTGMDGIELTKQIKTCSPNTAVLVISGRGYESCAAAVLKAGASGYLLRNVRVDQLVDTVRALHSGIVVLDGVAASKVLPRGADVRSGVSNRGLIAELSWREMDILKLVAKAKSNKEIGKELSLSVRTVESHLANIFTKMEVGSRMEAVFHALKEGWLNLVDLP